MDWTKLRQQIEQHFNEEDLRTLCFDLGLDYDNLGGRGKAANIRELITHFQRNGRYQDLYTQLNHHRPHVNWPEQSPIITDSPTFTGPAPIPASAAERRIRSDLLNKVRQYWIQGFLEKSLHNIARLELGFTYQPEAVSRSWSVVLQQENEPEELLPANMSILEMFRQHHEFLILGEPGTGKTITLLELARDLITIAEVDETQSIPVVFNLATWAEKQLPFADWLAEALFRQYQVARKIGQQWVANDYQLILLLDGLDEVQQEHREACATAINTFRAEHMVDIVITSRITDYKELTTPLNLATALRLQPLTLEQIDDYLAAGRESLAALRRDVKEDPDLQALAQTPLLLSMMALTYRNRSLSELGSDRPLEQRERLFDRYTQHMFNRRGLSLDTIMINTKRLAWLAHHMTLRAQTIFTPSNLEPSWLPTQSARYLFIICIGLIYGLPTGLLVRILSSSPILEGRNR